MAIELCVLASGSAGNCTMLRTPAGVVLVDAGLAPRMTAARMNGTGVRLGDVSAICLTHLDRDHFSFAWLDRIIDRKINVFCHAARVADALRYAQESASDTTAAEDFARQIVGFDEVPFEPLTGLTFDPIRLAHDNDGSHGFVVEGFGRRIGYATDLGHVPPHLAERFCGVDVLCIESNYDPRMQHESGRPVFLKQRIMGGRGHLSNEQALDAVRQVIARCRRRGLSIPEHVVLLHRSRECNCPRLLRSLFCAAEEGLAERLTLAEQFARTQWIRPRGSKPLTGEQLQLAWG